MNLKTVLWNCYAGFTLQAAVAVFLLRGIELNPPYIFIGFAIWSLGRFILIGRISIHLRASKDDAVKYRTYDTLAELQVAQMHMGSLIAITALMFSPWGLSLPGILLPIGMILPVRGMIFTAAMTVKRFQLQATPRAVISFFTLPAMGTATMFAVHWATDWSALFAVGGLALSYLACTAILRSNAPSTVNL